ncbi:MAG: hypothetical protein JWM34_2657 [Ilumatobacteraceae bacterium]|nr:hypothetical protein [Ilumatobacteraceae bacterium]
MSNGASENGHTSNGSGSNGSSSNGSSSNGSSPKPAGTKGDGAGSNGSSSNGKPASTDRLSPPPVAPITTPPLVPPADLAPASAVGDVASDGSGDDQDLEQDNVVAFETPSAKLKRSLRRSKVGQLFGGAVTDGSATEASATDTDAPTSSAEDVVRPASPITSPVAAVTMDSLPVVEHAPPSGPPMPIDPGLMRGPATLVPSVPPPTRPIPLPALFDDEIATGDPLSFDRLFDPVSDTDRELPPGAAARPVRPRSFQFTQPMRRQRRPRVRRVTRVVRHIDPWSVFKVALCFSMVLYGVCLTAGVLLWNVAYTTGTIDNVQRFFESFGWDTFRFKGGQLFHNAWIAGLFVALGLTGLIVLAATLFNLITDLVGGIRITVLEEEVVEKAPVAKGPLLRRRGAMVGAKAFGPRPGQPTLTDDDRDPFSTPGDSLDVLG